MRTYTLLASVVVHAALIGAAFVAHLVATDELPTPRVNTTFVRVRDAPLPVVPPPASAVRTGRTTAAIDATPLAAPDAVLPERLTALNFEPAFVNNADGIVGFATGTETAGIAAPPVPPPAPPKAPIRVGGAIRPPQKIVHVAPVYPTLARSAGVSGIVILEAMIDEEGRVRDVRVLRSVPLLDRAAADAVWQWRFTPTSLNGDPVPVVMTVTVNFALN